MATIPQAGRRTPPSTQRTASTSTDNMVTFDNVAPTVTINQAAAPADPTGGGPILFDVQFSEPVYGFNDGRCRSRDRRWAGRWRRR